MVTINAPIEKVFGALANIEIVVQVSSVALVGTKGKNGELWSYAYWKYLNVRSRTIVTEVDRQRKLV